MLTINPARSATLSLSTPVTKMPNPYSIPPRIINPNDCPCSISSSMRRMRSMRGSCRRLLLYSCGGDTERPCRSIQRQPTFCGGAEWIEADSICVACISAGVIADTGMYSSSSRGYWWSCDSSKLLYFMPASSGDFIVIETNFSDFRICVHFLTASSWCIEVKGCPLISKIESPGLILFCHAGEPNSTFEMRTPRPTVLFPFIHNPNPFSSLLFNVESFALVLLLVLAELEWWLCCCDVCLSGKLRLLAFVLSLRFKCMVLVDNICWWIFGKLLCCSRRASTAAGPGGPR